MLSPSAEVFLVSVSFHPLRRGIFCSHLIEFKEARPLIQCTQGELPSKITEMNEHVPNTLP